MTCKAIWNGVTVAESDQCLTTEGNLYFPTESVRKEYFNPTRRCYTCLWKGRAGYYDIVVEGKVNKDAAWSYFKPSAAAQKIKNYVAFDRSLGVKVEGDAVGEILPPW